MEQLVQMFTNNNTAALGAWESSGPCQDAESEAREKYGFD
jgi:hypothetical protein